MRERRPCFVRNRSRPYCLSRWSSHAQRVDGAISALVLLSAWVWILLEPPQQKRAWTAPAVDLPDDADDGQVATLFRDGMADPRAVSTECPGTRRLATAGPATAGVISTHLAGALPAKDGDKQRFGRLLERALSILWFRSDAPRT